MSVALRACISYSSSFRRRRKRLETICRPPSSLTRVGDKWEILQRSEGPAAFGLSVQKTDLKPKYVYHTMLTTAEGESPPVCCPLHNYATYYRDNSPRPPPLPTPPTNVFFGKTAAPLRTVRWSPVPICRVIVVRPTGKRKGGGVGLATPLCCGIISAQSGGLVSPKGVVEV